MDALLDQQWKVRGLKFLIGKFESLTNDTTVKIDEKDVESMISVGYKTNEKYLEHHKDNSHDEKEFPLSALPIRLMTLLVAQTIPWLYALLHVAIGDTVWACLGS